MIPVESVIQKLVNEFEFVVIPGFGALLSRQVAAYYDETTGKFSPPSKRLAFNEFIKLDDGLLANYISRHEKISHGDALMYVKLYTEVLRASLQNIGSAEIIGIGSFVFNDEGKLVFEPTSVKYFKDDWFGFHEIKVKLADSSVVPREAAYQKVQHVEYVEELHFEEEKKQSWITWAAAAMVAGLLCYFSFFLVSSNEELNKSNLNPFSYFLNKKEAKVREVVKPVETKEDAFLEPTTQESSVVVDSVVTDSVTEVLAKEEILPVVKEEVKTVAESTADEKYYLIAGAFKGSKQAGILLEEMKKKGYTNAVLIPGDENNKKVKVAVEGFASEADAYAASNQLKMVIGEKGWIYRKR